MSSKPSAQNIFHTALGHHQAGRLAQAEALYRQVLELEPNHPDTLNLLGMVARQTGRLDAAFTLISQAIAARPAEAAFHNSLAQVLRDQGKQGAALSSYRRALALKPDHLESLYSMGNALQMSGQLDEAIFCYRKAIAIKPDFAEALGNLGSAVLAQGKLDEAIACYRKAIAIKPNYAEAHNNLGIALHNQGDLDGAVESYRKAIATRPNYAEAHHNLGNTLREQGKRDDALASLRQAIALKPDYADARIGLARLCIDLGQFDDARTELSSVFASRPEHPVAWAMLTQLRKMTQEDSGWLDTALRLVSRPGAVLPAMVAVELHFATGKYYDDTGQYDLAFAAYRKANALKAQMDGKFDRAGFSRMVDTLIANYTAAAISQARAGASPSRRPVFIVGMLRSGTSLTEQIIASHPQAYGAGELGFWSAQSDLALLLPENLEAAAIAKIAAGYEQCLRQHSTAAARVVDKMPGNFLWLGPIATVFPQARIIHTRRNPIDTCLSIYFQNLRSVHSYGTDLDDLAFYYREYARLMRHWRAVLPADRFLEVPYEALVDDQAGWSRRIIEFIGLEWDERCLEFHKTERKVGTASNWQVRQKIYSSSKERWRRYEKHLGPLLGLLDLDQA